MLLRLVVACLVMTGVAHAQPATVIGKPLPAPDLPDGTLVVRVVDGEPRKPVPRAVVWIDVDGKARTATADQDGRATFAKLPAGARVTASASRRDDLVSERFTMPATGGVKVMLSQVPLRPAAPSGPPRAVSGRPVDMDSQPRDTVVVMVAHDGDGVAPDPVEVTLVGYHADERVAVQRARTDGTGRARFSGLDATGSVAYYALAWLPRGKTGDRLDAAPIVLNGTTGAGVTLVGAARGAPAPGIDDPHDRSPGTTPRVPAGKVRVEVRGTTAPVMPVELFDAATRKKIATGDANDTAQAIVFDVAPKPGLVLYAEVVGLHGLRARSLPFVLAPDRGATAHVLLYPRLLPSPSFMTNADEQLLWGGVSWEVNNTSWIPYGKKLVLPLPRGARELAIEAESRGRIRATPAGLEVIRPLPPGVTDLRAGFELPVGKGVFAWHLDLPDGAFKGSFSAEKQPDLAIELPAGSAAKVTETTVKGGRVFLTIDDYTISPGGTLEMKIRAPSAQPDGALFRACRKLSPDRTSALIGKPAPDFTLPAVGGGPPVKLSALRGRPVLLNFMASWYSAGRELPTLAALAKEVPAVAVVLLASDRDPADAQGKLGRLALTAALDKPPRDDENIGAVTHDSYGISLLPETYLVDKKGLVRLYLVNLREWDTPAAIACVKALAASP